MVASGAYQRLRSSVMLVVVLFAARPAMAQQDCTAGRFEAHAPYSHDETLPFDFNQPAGWAAQSSPAAHRLVTVHKPHKDVPLNAVPVTIDVAVSFQPDLHPAMTEDVWRQTMDVVAKVPYGRDTLVIYSQSWATTAKFLVPHGGKRYQVIINFNNSEYCRAEAVKLRELVINSLTPNSNTTFPAR